MLPEDGRFDSRREEERSTFVLETFLRWKRFEVISESDRCGSTTSTVALDSYTMLTSRQVRHSAEPRLGNGLYEDEEGLPRPGDQVRHGTKHNRYDIQTALAVHACLVQWNQSRNRQGCPLKGGGPHLDE